jgi:hypothetical protein
VENWGRQEDRKTGRKKKSIQGKKKSIQERREMESKQPSSTAEIR